MIAVELVFAAALGRREDSSIRVFLADQRLPLIVESMGQPPQFRPARLIGRRNDLVPAEMCGWLGRQDSLVRSIYLIYNYITFRTDW
ncbi:hypothetical protein [Sphingomonas mali]|uniref:hypothetical protein n=1 Tax=Sphingomonas mali TaxID=40682 RepID=UPI0012ED5B90|nr:hypothetical protein [Sphingomonas mali]